MTTPKAVPTAKSSEQCELDFMWVKEEIEKKKTKKQIENKQKYLKIYIGREKLKEGMDMKEFEVRVNMIKIVEWNSQKTSKVF